MVCVLFIPHCYTCSFDLAYPAWLIDDKRSSEIQSNTRQQLVNCYRLLSVNWWPIKQIVLYQKISGYFVTQTLFVFGTSLVWHWCMYNVWGYVVYLSCWFSCIIPVFGIKIIKLLMMMFTSEKVSKFFLAYLIQWWYYYFKPYQGQKLSFLCGCQLTIKYKFLVARREIVVAKNSPSLFLNRSLNQKIAWQYGHFCWKIALFLFPIQESIRMCMSEVLIHVFFQKITFLT